MVSSRDAAPRRRGRRRQRLAGAIVGVLTTSSALAQPTSAQERPALVEEVARLKSDLAQTIAAIEGRRAELAGRGGDPGAEDALGRFVTEIIFETGDVTIDAGARQRLAGVAEAMRQLGTTEVRIVGYSDRTGPAAVNTELAMNRAAAVSDLFVEAGFPADRVRTLSALASGLPLPVPTPEGVAEPRNRSARVFAAAR